MTSTDDLLDATLRAGDPARTLSADPEYLQPALADLLATSRTTAEQQATDEVAVDHAPAPITLAAARARRARRLALRAGALGSVLVVSGACVAAAAGLIDLHTGFFGSPGMSENDTGEFLDISSPNLGPLMQRYAGDMPLAPGYSLDPLIEQVHDLGVHDGARDDSGVVHGGLMQADGIASEVAYYSACTWDRSWLGAHAAGDQDAQDRATAVIAAVPTWPVIVRTAGDQATLDAFESAADAARRGDATTMRSYADSRCPDQR